IAISAVSDSSDGRETRFTDPAERPAVENHVARIRTGGTDAAGDTAVVKAVDLPDAAEELERASPLEAVGDRLLHASPRLNNRARALHREAGAAIPRCHRGRCRVER